MGRSRVRQREGGEEREERKGSYAGKGEGEERQGRDGKKI